MWAWASVICIFLVRSSPSSYSSLKEVCSYWDIVVSPTLHNLRHGLRAKTKWSRSFLAGMRHACTCMCLPINFVDPIEEVYPSRGVITYPSITSSYPTQESRISKRFGFPIYSRCMFSCGFHRRRLLLVSVGGALSVKLC
jgi:hypothetical protein